MILKNLTLIPAFVFFLFIRLAAQNINGLEIPVSRDKLSSITFHSEVTNYYFKDKTSPYKVSTLGNNALMIQTPREVKEPHNLTVIEGSRKHEFVLVYKDDIDLSEQDKDFSDLKDLDKLVKSLNNGSQNNASQINSAQDRPNTVSPTTGNSNDTPENTGTGIDNKSNNNDFDILLDAASKAKAGGKFAEAKSKYEQALLMQPDNDYIKSQVAEINQALANQSSLKYTDFITKANNAFTADHLDEALNYYNSALSIQTGDNYATVQINLIKKKQEAIKTEAANKEKDSLFNNYIDAGDKSLLQKSYDAALIQYNEALKIKPDNPTATSKINIVKERIQADSIETDRKAMDNLYTSYLNTGDKASKERSYSEARIAYNEALKIKPGDALALSKLGLIDKQIYADSLQAELNKTKALYDNYISNANDAFKKKLYDEAKNYYAEALKLNPEDSYSRSQLNKIDEALENIRLQAQQDLEAQKNEERKKQYADLIAAADNYYNSGMLVEARGEYRKALEINNKDLYSQNKVSQINRLLLQQKEKIKQDSLNDVKYTALIFKADEDFNNKDYAKAKSSYLGALKYKTDDSYAKSKLEQIESAEQEIAEKDRLIKDSIAKDKEITGEYNALIAKAKAAYSKDDYVMAIGYYTSANALKPGEDEPKNRISEIDNLLNERAMQLLQKNMADSLSNAADIALANFDYNTALHDYIEALKLDQTQDTIYIKKQINYSRKQIALSDSLNNQAKVKEEQQKKLDETMDNYREGKDALKILDYNNALIFFTRFIDAVDTLGFSQNEYDLEALVKFSKAKIIAINDHLEREKHKDTTTRKPPDIKSLPGVTIIFYPHPKDPQLDSIYKKYPDIGFNLAPGTQIFDTIDLSQENKLKSKEFMSASSGVIAENSNNGITVKWQDIIFKESKAYIKFTIQNSTSTEFLTGSMLLTQKKQNGDSIHMLPVYVSGYPVVLPNKYPVMVYVTKYKEISDNDNLNFTVTDRLNTTKITVTIPGSAYNKIYQNERR